MMGIGRDGGDFAGCARSALPVAWLTRSNSLIKDPCPREDKPFAGALPEEGMWVRKHRF